MECSVLVSQTSFGGRTSGSVAKCRLFSRATFIGVYLLFTSHIRSHIRILERVQSSKTLQSFSNPRFTISASYQQSPTDKWPGILRNNKSWNSELCRERMWESWRDRKTAHWIREETKVPDIMEIISTLKWNWACYLARTTDNRWTISITFRTRRGHIRNWGKPRTRWREDLDGFQNL